MDLALCISLKPRGSPGGDQEELAELDGDDVLEAVSRAMRRLGAVRVWDTAILGPAVIAAQPKPDLIFNIAEGVYGTARESQAPALFEWLQWPYVGSDPVTLAIAHDKWYTKQVLAAEGIPTPRAMLLHRGVAVRDHALRFPLIVKPVAEGSGKGIRATSVVESEGELAGCVEAILERYRQPALVEEFLWGREFTVSLIGNVGRWEVLPLAEIKFGGLTTSRHPIYGFEAKWSAPTRDDIACPAGVPENLRRAIDSTAVRTCDALRIRDWARIDLRLDAHGTPHVLDVNPLPGIMPGSAHISCFTRAAYAAGMDFDGLIRRLIETALARYRSEWFLPHRVKA
jgi:D-alanine-D-alanine ligase